MQQPKGIVSVTYNPDGQWVEHDGKRYQRTFFVVIDNDLEWHGVEHDLITTWAAEEMLKLKRHADELIVIRQPKPSHSA